MTPESSRAFDAIQYELSHNVIAGPDSIFGNFVERDVQAIVRLLAWHDQDNVYASNHRFLSMHHQRLDEWNALRGLTETNSRQGAVEFLGGDIQARVALDPQQLTPEDFRLSPKSSGYHALPDGKDVGADIDLVGPGEAYARWKHTPQYQQWLEATGQTR
jgi:hypothetical protein